MKRSIIDDQRTSAVHLSTEELQRYSRHLIMPEVTADGQRRLKAARALCIGAGELESAQDRLRDINPEIEIELHRCRFSSENASQIVSNYDVVVDGSDNFATRYLSNDVCVFEQKPNVYGSVFRFEGQTTVFAPHLGGPCYRCLFPEPPPPESVPNCAQA